MEHKGSMSDEKDKVSDNSVAHQEYACSSIEDNSSNGVTAKDFKDTPKYKDTESYASQHHHAIGTGLFLTDAIKDLPPRFRDKVIRALEEGAAVNNIPLERIPVDSLFSVHDDSNQEKKNLDPLVIQSSLHSFNKSSNTRKHSSHPSRQEYDSRKSCNSFPDSNSNFESNIQHSQVPCFDNINSKNDSSNDSMKRKSHFKSKSHISAPNFKDSDRNGANHQKEKAHVQSRIKNTSHLIQKSNPSQTDNCSETSQRISKFSPKNSSMNSVPQRNNHIGETKEPDIRSVSGRTNKKANDSDFNKSHPNATFHSSQYAPDSSRSPVKNKFSAGMSFNSKQHDYYNSNNLTKNRNDEKLLCKESFHSDDNKFSSASDKNRIGNNISGKNTKFYGEIGKHKNNRSRCASVSSSHSSSISHCDKDMSNDEVVYYNREHKKFPYESHKSLDFSKGSVDTDVNPVNKSFFYKNPAHRQNKKNVQNPIKMSEDIRSNFSDSSQISNTSPRGQNSSTLVSKRSSDNAHFESLGRFDKKLNKRKDNITAPDQQESKKQCDPEILNCDFNDSHIAVSNTNDNRNCNSQLSNYSRERYKSNNRKPEKNIRNNIQSFKRGIKSTDLNQNLQSCSPMESSKLRNRDRGCIEHGFFVKIEVSEEARNLEYWVNCFRSMFSFQFDLERCCHFSDILILEFDRKEQAQKALIILWREKRKHQNSKSPHMTHISTLNYHLYKPCSCKQNVIDDSLFSLKKHAETSLSVVDDKIYEIKNLNLNLKKGTHIKDNSSAKREMLKAFVDSRSNFLSFKDDICEKIKKAESLKEIQQFKFSLLRECNAFKRCLPIYSKKKEIMYSVQFYSVSVIVAETGSGKSTQLVEYLLHSQFSQRGYIICTQPRKLAAISIAQFVSGQVGSAVGKIVGYDVGMERKCCEVTKIIYMTDYCLLKKFLRDPTLKDVSCIIIDEAHERSLYTDLVLGMLKKCIENRLDLRVIITSATINPAIFVEYFKMCPESVIEVPGRSYPVDVIWWPDDVDKGWNYVDACVQKVFEIYTRQREGDILVFLTSASESEEAIYLFKRLLSSRDKKPQLLSLHGKSDIHEQMQVFQILPQTSRKIVFATNVAETSVTIPGIKYVVDSGMTKDLKFDPKMNKSYLEVTFINKSAAEQRKGRAGRTQSGVCYRMYSKRNYEENMADNAVPEVLKTNLQKALLKIFELGINPRNFNFIEAPPERTISNSVDSLEYLGAIKNDKLTVMGRKIAKLPVEPQLAKLILQGIEAGLGYELIIIASMVTESGKLFIRNGESRTLADEKKKKFCQEGGDLCTYLEIYKRWKEVVGDRFRWCVDNYISSKAMKSAAKSVFEIIFSLRTELGMKIAAKFNNSGFQEHYEKILFDCFSENLCVSSGHPKLGYLSPYLPESFFIHPSSTIAYLGKDSPEFLVYTTLMETSRNFLFDITPISEETIKLANQNGSFNLPLHSLRCMQMPPQVMGPFGESVLVRYILGKQGSKIRELEARIQSLTKVKNAYVDVAVDKGLITVYSAQRFHEKVSKEINHVIEQAHYEILKEEDVIKFWGTLMHFALGAGGLINDIIMPGEFRELIFCNVSPKEDSHLEERLANYGSLQSVCRSYYKQETKICVTFKKVCDAQKAFQELKGKNLYSVSSKPYLPNVNDNTLPLFMLNVSWCRRPCSGQGSVEFFSEEDLIVASGILTCNSFSLCNNLIIFSPSENSTKELSMKHLPKTVDELAIRKELRKRLPNNINIKNINIIRRQCSVDEKTAKQQLLQLFSCYVPSTRFVIQIINPTNSELWKANVYFECHEDLENTLMKLKDNTKIDSYPLLVKRVFKSSLHCKNDVYNTVSKQVLQILEDKKRKCVCEEFSVKQLDTQYGLSVEFTCISINELNKTRQELRHFLLGDSFNLLGTSKYNFLFSDCHWKHIKEIQKLTSTRIELNKFRKVITIYGSFNNCQKAKQQIYSLASNPDFSFTRTFNLRDSCIPAGFLKELYLKYGYDLLGLVNEFDLTIASINNFGKTLTLKGLRKGIKKAEEVLEEICEKLFKSKGERQNKSNQLELCPICFDPVSYDFQRLEHCGHAFCRQCLLLQVESKILPVVCVKENCGKLIFLEDIKRIISYGGDHLRKAFCTVALHHHVSSNVGKLSYCATPDCQMIYRITEEELLFQCPACKNSTCTHCQALYHHGMSCEMFQKSQEDEDYSLKTWMKENESERKYCPSCKVVIEKESGCNHMECLNCKVHLCWLCLQIFPSGSEVYEHLPFCPKNQSVK